jgi:hypothetical protein
MEALDGENSFLKFYESVKDRRHASGTFEDPGQQHDDLYPVNEDGSRKPVQREVRPAILRTQVWYGPIGSGDKLMKNARKRNEPRDKYKACNPLFSPSSEQFETDTSASSRLLGSKWKRPAP